MNIQSIDFSVNLLRAILWQYDSAPNLLALINKKSDWYNENYTQFWQNWITNVFDLRTANQFGLTVWGVILNLQLYVSKPPVTTGAIFGFDDSSYSNFDNGNFLETRTNTYVLPIETQRLALRLRYYQLTGTCTVPGINRMLKDVFASYGKAYVYDYKSMSQRYIFLFPVNADLEYLLNNYDILPRPAGVKSDYIDATKTYFGFAGNGVGFDQANFYV